jgi:Family of unknown function (DUF6338)
VPDFSKIDLWSVVALVLPGLMMMLGYALSREGKLKLPAAGEIPTYILLTILYVLALWSRGHAVQTGGSIFNLDPDKLFWRYIIWPFGLGLTFGVLARFDILGWILRRAGIEKPEPPPIRTPWPVIAPTITVGTYLMVILKDKTIYRALVTEDSQLSSDQDKIDLYLGQTFEGDDWTPSSPQRAVYIRGSEIQSIEIWKFDETAGNALGTGQETM